MITTTLNRIRENHPCEEGWTKLLRGLGKTKADDEPVAYATILRINGLDDTLWRMRAEPQHAHLWCIFAVRCARRVEHLMADQRSRDALDVAERHANGQATDDELAAAARDAEDAACAVAWVAARAAASAARAAEYAARAAEYAARAAEYAARAAEYAAWAAASAAEDAAWVAASAAASAARAAARAAQSEILLDIVGREEAKQ